MTATDSSGPIFHGANAHVGTYLTDVMALIPAAATAHEAAVAMAEAGVGVAVIGTPTAVTGVVSERDIVRAVARGADLDTTTAIELGSTDLYWIDIDDTVEDAAEEMMEDYVRHVLVRGAQGLMGVLSIRDVLSAYIT